MKRRTPMERIQAEVASAARSVGLSVSFREDVPRKVWGKPLAGPEDAARVMARIFDLESRFESFAVLALDTKLRPCAPPLLLSGKGPSFVAVNAREVFRYLIDEGADAFFCAHNHPSGNATPSAEDRRLDRILREIGTGMNIRLLDSFVATPGEVVSLVEGSVISTETAERAVS